MFAPPDPHPPRGGEAHPALSASTVGLVILSFVRIAFQFPGYQHE